MKPVLWSLPILAGMLAACNDDDNVAPVPQPPSHQAISLNILHTNDHHSYFESQTMDLALDYDAQTQGSEKVRVQLGGFSRIASAIEEYRDPNTLVLNSGELNGTLYFSLFKGEVDIQVFNYLGLDAYQLGNHEFDEGDAHLADLIDMANFPIIAGNVHPTAQSPLYGKPILPRVIKEIDGEKVAIIGVLKVEKTRESSMVSEFVSFTDEVESVKAQVNELQAEDINKIIVLSHLGYEFDKQLASQVNGIDIIIGGDTHDVLDSTGELAQMGIAVDGEYPTKVNNPEGKPVYIAQAWEYAKGLGRLNIKFDAQGNVEDIQGNLELLVADQFQVQDAENKWVAANDVQQQAINQRITAMTSIRTIAADTAVDAILAPYKQELESFKQSQLGHVEQTMPFTRIPTAFAAGEQPSGSFAAQVVADAFLHYLPKADVAIQNAGGVRAELHQGPFTVADAYQILPFSNTVVTLDLTGAEILQVLNEALEYAQGISASTGAFPYSSHLRYDVVLNAAAQQGIKNLEIKDRTTGQWQPIDLQAIYSVATNSFTALGKDGYLTFGQVREARPDAFEQSDVVYAVPLLEYFKEVLPNQSLPALDWTQYCLKSVVVTE
ncbi:5'-nucleotidase C-terminal domain-containing protein [Bowmanella sp. Y26]|uniref:5'-nucleotidase C-terminal domain-containing protein n=1 Tax=Bowmanella yangjiangensis TaxID=2811230 RepID=UPI001BDC8691|nr:5'-nucleotidase C-terminal domain-containing protein [Bowmanella yangjiangensis]MBT1064224.1 5'-nucleotidase C-terminal domain-containing protein [Bowmanella yangjiangensis]